MEIWDAIIAIIIFKDCSLLHLVMVYVLQLLFEISEFFSKYLQFFLTADSIAYKVEI